MELALCGRSDPLMWPLGERRIKDYSSLHQILLVGEGDFSFSSALANAFGSAFNMVATSLDSRAKIIGYYPSACDTLQNLEKLGATVLHGVDVATMDQVRIINERLYHRIVYNFPHAGFWGREHDKAVIKKHRRLVKLFFKNARTMLSRMGEVHVAHKEKYPYNKWKLEKQAGKCGLFLKESVKFDRKDYPGYVNRRGDGPNMGRTFFLGACRTYKFILCPSFFDTLHLLPIKPILPWSAENAPWDASPCFPTSIRTNALLMDGSLWASVKRGYEFCGKEEIFGRQSAPREAFPCLPTSIQTNALLTDGTLRASVKRGYQFCEEEDRPAVRRRTEDCHSFPRGNDTTSYRAAAVELSMAYFQARYPGKMSLLNMVAAFGTTYSRFPSIATGESAMGRDQPSTFPGSMNGLRFGFL